MNLDDNDLFRRIHDDVVDSFDEELELELEDHEPADLTRPLARSADPQERQARRFYFQELFRLQAELV